MNPTVSKRVSTAKTGVPSESLVTSHQEQSYTLPLISVSLFTLVCILAYFLVKAVSKASAFRKELAKFGPVQEIESVLARLKVQVDSLKEEVRVTTESLLEYELSQTLQETLFYRPRYEFEDLAHYAEALQLIREAEKELVRQKRAFLSSNGQELKGALKGLGKLGLAAFNSEADSISSLVTYNNFEQCKEKLRIAFNKMNNLLGPQNVLIASEYLELKIQEMAIAYDFQQAEEKKKQEQAELKAQMKEEEQAREESEKAREDAIKKQQRSQSELETLLKEMESKSEAERSAYEERIRSLQAKYDEATAERERATAMAQITKKGYVYIISNIGSFGENVFKIGLTRRKDPYDRVRELSDASVPFSFDVHAVIPADDAPSLEHSLHEHFAHRRMNKANLRKEFFKTSLDEITRACTEKGLQIKLTALAEAREYRESLAIEEEKKAA